MVATLSEAFEALVRADTQIEQVEDRIEADQVQFPAALYVAVRLKLKNALGKSLSVYSFDFGDGEKKYGLNELIDLYEVKKSLVEDLKAEKGEEDSEYRMAFHDFTIFMTKVLQTDLEIDLKKGVEDIIRRLIGSKVKEVVDEPGPASDPEPESPGAIEQLGDPEFLKTQFVMVGPGYIVRGDHANVSDLSRLGFEIGGQQMVVPNDSRDAAQNFGLSEESASFFDNPLKGKEVFGLGEGDVESGIPNPVTGEMKALPKLKPEMFPDVEDEGVIAEGNTKFVMAGIAPELGCDCTVLMGNDGKVYADHDLFRGFFDQKVCLIKDGDGFRVEEV